MQLSFETAVSKSFCIFSLNDEVDSIKEMIAVQHNLLFSTELILCYFFMHIFAYKNM